MSPLSLGSLSGEPRVGDGTVIHPTAVIAPNVTIGANCIIQAGAVIGMDGFGYTWNGGRWAPKPHDHGVVIEDDVHIGANTCIDRGSWQDTRIERGTRIDNLVHIAHNVRIGQDVIIVAQAEVSGSVEIGDQAWIGPRACIKERLRIGPRALVGMGAVVIKNVGANTTVAGSPARVINAEVGVRDNM